MNRTLTNKQIIFLIFSYIVGYGIISLPKNIAEHLGTGGWIAIVTGDIIIIFCAYLFIYLAKTFNNKTIFEYSKILTGTLISYLIISVIGIYSIATATITIKLSCETIKLSFLLNTPTWALTIVLVLVCFYTLLNDIKVLARVFGIFSIIFIIFALILDIATFSQGNLTNLQPFFIIDINALYKVMPKLIFPFIGIEILAVIPMDFKGKNKHIFKYILILLLFIGFIYIMNVESSISVMGVDSIVHYEDARFASIRRVEIDALQFLKRLDSIFIVAWILSVFGTIILTLYMTIFLLNKLFSKINRNFIVIIIMSIVLALTLIPTTMDILREALNYVSYFGLFILLVLPLMLCTITLIKKHFKKL
ncbi:germination protein BB [Vallitalea longa]|uniref:Germination protein BB n=1 Tax=Vallitalea longa TaxID=2936439 RepID=A0A9W5Y7W6_9FIRM|nr:endospore germination permease [Vallitalea longa]GKX28004.1 germination protein BB [Vallitalea longa]